MSVTRAALPFSIALFVTVSSATALAQDSTSPAAAQGATPGAPRATNSKDESRLEEARQRYQRGLQLFNEANYEAARVEFERAYQLAPSYKILYNIGLSYEQLGDYVQAQVTLQRYLELGGNEITPERRGEVTKELAQIQPRVARVIVRSSIENAELLVDDQCGTDVTTSLANCGPMSGTTREILVNPGLRRITLRKDGYLPETRPVTVAGSDRAEIRIVLKPLPKYVASDPGPRNRALVAWGATAVFAGTATVFGVLALNSNDKLESQRGQFGVDPDGLAKQSKTAKTQGILCDVFGAVALVSAGVATYFTIKAFRSDSSEKPDKVKVEGGIGPGYAGVRGTF